MLVLAIVCFTMAALLGVYLISFVLQNKETPKSVAFIHGFFAAAGVITLILYPFYYRDYPLVSTVLFVLAAMGGFVLIYRDLTGKPLPKWMALGHGLVAVTAFIFLLAFAFM